MKDAKLSDLLERIERESDPFLLGLAADRADEIRCPALARVLRWMSVHQKHPAIIHVYEQYTSVSRYRWHSNSKRVQYRASNAELPGDILALINPNEPDIIDYPDTRSAIAALAIALELYEARL